MIAQVQIIQRKSIHAAEQALLKGEAFIKKLLKKNAVETILVRQFR